MQTGPRTASTARRCSGFSSIAEPPRGRIGRRPCRKRVGSPSDRCHARSGGGRRSGDRTAVVAPDRDSTAVAVLLGRCSSRQRSGCSSWVRSYAPLYAFGGPSFPTPSQGVRSPSRSASKGPRRRTSCVPEPVTLSVGVSSEPARGGPSQVERRELAGGARRRTLVSSAVEVSADACVDLAMRPLPRAARALHAIRAPNELGRVHRDVRALRCAGLPTRSRYSPPVTRTALPLPLPPLNFTAEPGVPLVAPRTTRRADRGECAIAARRRRCSRASVALGGDALVSLGRTSYAPLG